MKDLKFFTILICIFCFSTVAFASSSGSDIQEPRAQDKYAIILAHGMAANEKIFGLVDYFYGVQGWLEDKGWTIYQTGDKVSQWNDAMTKGAEFTDVFYNEILPRAKADLGNNVKFHVIGHSHGCLYTRYAISIGSNNNPPIAPYVASHTSLCGPHRGSTVCDLLFNNRDNLGAIVADLTNMGFIEDVMGWLNLDIIDGVLDPLFKFMDGVGLEQGEVSALNNAVNLSTYGANYIFNKNVPNAPGVNYQSWASTVTGHNPLRGINLVFNPTYGYMERGIDTAKRENTADIYNALKTANDPAFSLNNSINFGGHPTTISALLQGYNDGLVDEESAKWGTYRGLLKGVEIDLLLATVSEGGVDHFQINNNLIGNTPGFSPKDFWVEDLLPTLEGYSN